jgi:hypothetical protein
VALFAAGSVVLLYGVAPIVIKFAQSLRVSPMMLEASLEELSPAARASLLELTRALGDVGFEALAYIRLPDQSPGSTGYLVLLVNREHGDIAAWACAQNAFRTDMMPSFTTRFDDDFEIVTRSWNQIGVFPQSPHEDRLNVPQIRDVRELYRVHCLRVNRSPRASGKRVVPQEGDVVEFIQSETRREYEWLAECGYFWLDELAERYRPTWKGAFLMMWKMLFPVKQVRRLMVRRHATAVLGELAFIAESLHLDAGSNVS